MIMFLSPRKTPLAKEKDAAIAATKAVRTIETSREINREISREPTRI